MGGSVCECVGVGCVDVGCVMWVCRVCDVGMLGV